MDASSEYPVNVVDFEVMAFRKVDGVVAAEAHYAAANPARTSALSSCILCIIVFIDNVFSPNSHPHYYLLHMMCCTFRTLFFVGLVFYTAQHTREGC